MTSKYLSTIQSDQAGHVTFALSDAGTAAAVDGKRIIITGGASGIGEACSRHLAAAGAYVVIADINSEAGKPLETALNTTNTTTQVKYIPVDISCWQSQLEMFAAALDFFPDHDWDALITSAGIGSSSDLNIAQPKDISLHSLTPAERSAIPPPSTKCLDVNLIGAMYSVTIASTYCTASPQTRSRRTSSRSIVLLGSTSGYRSLAGKIDYSVAKWGVRGYFRNVRSELYAKHGARINMMAPFWVPTTLTAKHVPALEKQGVKVGKLEEVVECIVRMIVDEEMNGRAISATGKGLEDIDDDLAGQDGGVAMQGLVRDGWLSASDSATMGRRASL